MIAERKIGNTVCPKKEAFLRSERASADCSNLNDFSRRYFSQRLVHQVSGNEFWHWRRAASF